MTSPNKSCLFVCFNLCPGGGEDVHCTQSTPQLTLSHMIIDWKWPGHSGSESCAGNQMGGGKGWQDCGEGITEGRGLLGP